MKHRGRIILAAAVAGGCLGLLAPGAPAQAPQDPQVQFQRAVQLETIEGNLNAAMDLYRQVITNSGNDRGVTAKALLRLGGCYEKLGREEARKTYLQLVTDYPEQQREVAAARQRLANLAKRDARASEPAFRKIHVPTKLPILGSGMLSPDGQKLAFISDGGVWLVAVHGKTDPDITGAPVLLTEAISAWDVSNVSLAWSIDGKWISFRTGTYRLNNPVDGHYIVPSDGGKPERLPVTWKDWPADVHTLRCALSADAETLYFADGNKPEELRIYSMPARGGEKRALTEPATRQPALSPDGSRIVYVKMHKNPNGYVADDQVWTQAVNGGDPVHICDAAAAWSPVFSPDGDKIAFLSRGASNQQIWIVPLAIDGRPSAPPSKFDLPGQTNNLLAGWARDNRIGVLIRTPELVPLYTVPAEGGKATQLTTEYTAMPRWIPDGSRIYFDGTHRSDRANLEYVPGEGGKVIRVPISPESIQPVFPSKLAISPDGKTLCYAGFYRDMRIPGSHLFTVPVEGGTASRLEAGSGDQKDGLSLFYNSPEWSPDGTHIAFIRSEGIEDSNIFAIPRDGGKPRQVSTREDLVERSNLAWSPDGKEIAFYGRDKTLRLIPTEGGRARILVPAVGGGLPFAGIAWSPDGKRIAYTAGGNLWVVSREGGDPEQIETGLDARHLKVDWSPDGKRLAFTASKGGEPELWLMEDFLPLMKATQK